MRYAILENNFVENIIVADQDFINLHYPNAVKLSDEDVVNLGWEYKDGQFVKPIPVVIEEPVNE